MPDPLNDEEIETLRNDLSLGLRANWTESGFQKRLVETIDLWRKRCEENSDDELWNEAVEELESEREIIIAKVIAQRETALALLKEHQDRHGTAEEVRARLGDGGWTPIHVTAPAEDDWRTRRDALLERVRASQDPKKRCEFIGEVEVFGLPGYLEARCVLEDGHDGEHQGPKPR